jgi:hypothetical protein
LIGKGLSLETNDGIIMTNETSESINKEMYINNLNELFSIKEKLSTDQLELILNVKVIDISKDFSTTLMDNDKCAVKFYNEFIHPHLIYTTGNPIGLIILKLDGVIHYPDKWLDELCSRLKHIESRLYFKTSDAVLKLRIEKRLYDNKC